MKASHLVLLASLMGLFALTQSADAQTITSDRYVDATGGDDSNDGTTAATAWKTLTKVNAQTFGAGARILFKAGESWTGRLAPQGSGSSSAPIRIDQYGTGTKPGIHGAGASEVIYLYNQEYWEISNLEITNTGPTDDYKRAIYVRAEDAGALHHFHLTNLEIHDVNSALSGTNSRYYGGIFFEVVGESVQTFFDDILIADNHVYDVDRTGISNQSSWWRRSLTSSFGDQIGTDGSGNPVYDNWVPSTNLVIRNNLIERTGGNGIIVRVSTDALIESNTMLYNAEHISGNAAFCFNTDNALFQFNEAAYTVYNDGDTDARGIDADYRTKNTVIQYNYLHHNGKGGVVATGGPGGTASVPRFNDGTIIRYNILAENEQMGIRVSGKLTNMRVHNNVFYTSEALNNTILVDHGSWSGAKPDFVQYYSNVFLHAGTSPDFNLTESTNVYFRNNVYSYGSSATDQPADPYALFNDPRLKNPSPNAGMNDLSGFELSTFSPAVGAGVRFSDHPTKDYFGNTVSSNALIDIGAHQLSVNRPTIELADADAYVRGGTYAATNFGSEGVLHLKAHDDPEYIRRAYVKFSPAQSYPDLTSVRLRLHLSAGNAQNARVRFVTDDSWSEATITWNNRPSLGAASLADQLNDRGMVEWDVTDLVAADLQAGSTVSFAILGYETLDSPGNLGKFYSREEPSAARKGVRPALLIDTAVGRYSYTPAADAYVRNGTPSTNYGSDPELMVKAAGSTTVRHAYLKFEPGQFGDVEKAGLRLYMTNGDQRTIRSRFVADDSWTEGGITWDNKPAFGTAGPSTVTDDEDFAEWDITDLVKDELLAGDKISLGLESLSTIASGVERYVSKEGATGDLSSTQGILIVEGALSASKSSAVSTSVEEGAPDGFEARLYPNPTSGSAMLYLSLRMPSRVQVVIYDVLGREIHRRAHELSAGPNELSIGLAALASGLYFVQVEAGGASQVLKIIAAE